MKILDITGYFVSTAASIDAHHHIHHVNPLTGLVGGGAAVFAAAVNSPIWFSIIIGVITTFAPIAIAALNAYRDKFRSLYRDERTKVIHLQLELRRMREVERSKFKEDKDLSGGMAP